LGWSIPRDQRQISIFVDFSCLARMIVDAMRRGECVAITEGHG
jgi:hypothetical protein